MKIPLPKLGEIAYLPLELESKKRKFRIGFEIVQILSVVIIKTDPEEYAINVNVAFSPFSFRPHYPRQFNSFNERGSGYCRIEVEIRYSVTNGFWVITSKPE